MAIIDFVTKSEELHKYVLMTNTGYDGWTIRCTFDSIEDIEKALTRVGDDFDYFIAEVKELSISIKGE